MMVQHNGLLCAAKALAILIIMALAMPVSGFAQSDQAARVKIQGPDAFGDVLLIRENEDIILFGLAGSVPSNSQVTVTADDGQEFDRLSTFTGQFPLHRNSPIRIQGGVNIASATITALNTEGQIQGTVNLDLESEAILDALRTYRQEANQVLSGTKSTVSKGTPPHALLDIVATDENDQPFFGKVLLTQRLVGSGSSATLVDQFEGLPAGKASFQIRSVTPFSQVEVYSTSVDIDNPDRTKRVHSIDTTFFAQGEFRSNGSFFPFNWRDVNSSNVNGDDGLDPNLYLRVTARRDPGDGGETPRYMLATITNNVETGVAELEVVNNNDPEDENAPGADGIANILGTADSYAIITAYAEDDANSDVLGQARADASGAFVLPVTHVFNEEGSYKLQQNAYLRVEDFFGNDSRELIAVETDNESNIFGTPETEDQGDGSYLITGDSEPLSWIIVTGENADGLQFNAGGTRAAADGSFVVSVTSAQSYSLVAIDQAGNESEPVEIEGDTSVADPYDLVASVDYPNIVITGMTERNANVLVFGFPLNQVPDEADTQSTQPENSFFIAGARANADGEFSVAIPGGSSRIVYLQSVDSTGNTSNYVGLDLAGKTRGLVAFDPLDIENQMRGADDIVTGRTVSADSGNPVSEVFVGAYIGMDEDSAANFPFYGELATPIEVNEDGTFEIEVPERNPVTGDFIETFYLVALDQVEEDFTWREVGFELIDTDAGLDREGPEIVFNPNLDDFELQERGKGESDMLTVKRVLPPNMGSNSIPDDAIPYIFVVADENDDEEIDVRSESVTILDYKPLMNEMGIPFPGSVALDLGQNYWDPYTQSVVGRSIVHIALMDEYGNLSPDPIPVFLDVNVDDPDPSDLTVTGESIFGKPGSVEPHAKVSVFENANKTELIATGEADGNGTFYIPLRLTQSHVYISTTDTAGNQSNPVKVKVTDPIVGTQFLILDGYGVLHTPSSELSAGFLEGDAARALAGVKKAGNPAQLEENSPLYVLVDDGTIMKMGASGDTPIDSEQINVSGKFARDLEVISYSPFAGYVLLGNGVIVPYGDAPFYGDIVQLQNGYSDVDRLRLEGSQLLFDDLNDNGEHDTEDTNGNGVLDVVVGPGGEFIINEDVNGNGELDVEPIINPEVLAQGFENDIARDLELVLDAEGNVKGYVILDGYGAMWAFGEEINASVVHVENTAGISEEDIFRALELIVNEEGEIIDFITMNGYGQLFGLPDGPLGAGSETEPDVTGHLNFVLDADTYEFDIARDIRMNPEDSNEDGTVDWQDGFYVLNGYGGIQAIGGAPELDEETPFLGFDIARDLEFGKEPPQ